MSNIQNRIAENVAQVRERIDQAAQRSGRTADQVMLVSVTKYVDAEIARILPHVGCQHLGESRPQALWAKAETLSDEPIQWHMIGHMQRNKIRRTLPLATFIHSADSERLLTAINEEAQRLECRPRLLVEVNVSGDVEKTGFLPDEATRLCSQLDRWPHVMICGLMAMSARESDAESARDDFVRLRELRVAMQNECPSDVELAHLSMGMSRDYEVAIEEGATMVRVGSALFEGAM